ncbi:MAG: hypothetical protein IH617_09925, partial [Hydrogenophaga sp.]|nr:hypothetical protein [Hydrogenophaga sp.]
FLGDKGDVHDLVVAEMRQVLADTELPPYLDDNAARMLSTARAAAQHAGLLGAQVLHQGKQIIWVPWRGTRCLLTLRLFAVSEKVKCFADDLTLTYPGLALDQFRLHLQRIASGQEDPAQLASFMDQKNFQKFDEYLDAPILNRANANDRLDLHSAQDAAAVALQELEVAQSHRENVAQV